MIFSVEYFIKYFEENLITRSGGGRDGMKPNVFWRYYHDQCSTIINKCLNGTFHFYLIKSY